MSVVPGPTRILAERRLRNVSFADWVRLLVQCFYRTFGKGRFAHLKWDAASFRVHVNKPGY
jgi:hypothetical protein